MTIITELKTLPTRLISQQLAGTHLIEIKNVSMVYHTHAGNFPALRDVNMKIQAGEFVAIVGKSGCGKTTLINVLTGIDHPTSGEVLVAGTPVHKLNENQLAAWRGSNVGIVFQFFQLLPTLTVQENIRIPMDFCNVFSPGERADRSLELLRMVGIENLANQLPSQLSGGQQQSAAIARALANDPQIIVTDEPTGNLDTRASEHVFGLLQQLAENGKTIIMVTHNDELARRASRVISMKDGEIVGGD
jgi:putative ABC transport system ATP-binding protein